MPIFLKILLLNVCLLTSFLAIAENYVITSEKQLVTVVNAAQPGDRVTVKKGYYRVNLTITEPIYLECDQGVILDGQHQGDTVRVQSANVSIEGCRIVNWGDNLTKMNAGVFIEKQAENVRIENNIFKGDTFGIWVDSAKSVKIYHNTIEGNLSVRSQDRGNGIHLFAVTDADVAFNEVFHTRDGIYIDTSNVNTLRNNHLHHLRYGIHYMYSYSNTLKENYTHHTRTGYALMQSKYLTVVGNRSEYDQNYGILMNYITYSTLHANTIRHVKQGLNPTGGALISGAEGKAMFSYNSLFNDIVGNEFSDSDIGIHLTAGSEDNKIYRNAFVHNTKQVKYVSNTKQDWSFEGEGNYWSDYLGWDMNDDGKGDVFYEPNDGIDKLLWKYPIAKLLMNSPAIEMLRWIQRQFPVFRSPGVRDSFPLMVPPEQKVQS